jgi:hypothetical protein
MKFSWKSILFLNYILNSDPVSTNTFKRPKGYIFKEEMAIRRGKCRSFDILITGFSIMTLAILMGQYLAGIIGLVPFIYFYVLPHIDKSPQIILTRDYIYIKNKGKISWKLVKKLWLKEEPMIIEILIILFFGWMEKKLLKKFRIWIRNIKWLPIWRIINANKGILKSSIHTS